MFQPGDELRLDFEAAHKVWLIGKLRQDDLDRHLPPQRGLETAVNSARRACSYPFAELVALECLSNQGCHEHSPRISERLEHIVWEL